jgi:cytochrome P450
MWRSIRNPIEGWPREVFEGGVHRSRFPGAPLVIADPALAAEILVERSDEFPHGELLNRVFAPIWGKGIFVAEGADWRWQRRAAAPAFRPAQMDSLVPVARRAAEEVLGRLSPGRAVDLQDETRRLTLKVLFDAVLSGGEDFPDKQEASREIDAFIARVGRIGATDILPILARWRPARVRRSGKSAVYIRERVDAMIARRRREDRPRGDLLDLLISAQDAETGRRMDDGLLRDNLLGFIAAGHETTAFALAWGLWLVASHPPTRRRLLAEIAGAAGDGPIEGRHLEQLKFTRQVVQETMRLFPAAVSIVRAATRDTRIGSYPVRRGGNLLIAVYALHRLEACWENPRAFDPDRFDPDRQGARPPGAYLPFGSGPRSCMGAAFAMTELVTALATLVRGLSFTPDPARPPVLGVRLGGMVARHGLWVIPDRPG